MRVDPPLKIEKIFFAFLDELDHSPHFNFFLEIYLCLTPPGLEISKQFFFLTLYPSLIKSYLKSLGFIFPAGCSVRKAEKASLTSWAVNPLVVTRLTTSSSLSTGFPFLEPILV